LPVDSKLVLVGEDKLEIQARTAEQRGDADQQVEVVLGAASDAPIAPRLVWEPDDPATRGKVVTRRTICRCVSRSSVRRSGAKLPGLDLDQQVAADDVDDKTVDGLLDAVAAASVSVFKLSVKRALVERPDRPGLGVEWSVDLQDGMHDELLLRRGYVAFARSRREGPTEKRGADPHSKKLRALPTVPPNWANFTDLGWTRMAWQSLVA
jgi:hypothetical protein